MVGPASPPGLLVGAAGFEPTTLSSRTIRATKLRHAPTGCPLLQGVGMIAEADREPPGAAGGGAGPRPRPPRRRTERPPPGPPAPRAGAPPARPARTREHH